MIIEFLVVSIFIIGFALDYLLLFSIVTAIINSPIFIFSICMFCAFLFFISMVKTAMELFFYILYLIFFPISHPLYILFTVTIGLCKYKISKFSDKSLIISTAKVLDINNNNGSIRFIFPYEDKYLTLTKGYITNKLHIKRKYIPADISQLIWKFHGYHGKYSSHYIMTYKHSSFKYVSSRNLKYMEILHPKHMWPIGKRYSIPTMVFMSGTAEISLFAWFVWILNAYKYLGKRGYGSEVGIMSLVCWPFSFILVMMGWRFNGIVARSKCVKQMYDVTNNVVNKYMRIRNGNKIN